MKHFLPFCLALTTSLQVLGQTFYVNGDCGDDAWTGLSPTCAAPDGPKRTIQAAIPTTGSPTVIVAPGVYAEQLVINRFAGSKPQWTITIESETGAANTVIEGTGQNGSIAVSVSALGNGGRLHLRGFTVRNVGTGVSSNDVVLGLDIRDCIFTDCEDAGVNIHRATRISNCVFHDNSNHGVRLVPGFQAEADIDHCTFRNNGGSAVYAQRAPARVTNSLVAFNGTPTQPALVGNEGGFLTLKNVTVVANNGPGTYSDGRPAFVQPPRLTAHNSIIWGNNSGGDQIVIVQGSAPPPVLDVQYCIVEGGFTGTANLSSDPLFVNAGAGDFHLAAGSPAIDSGYAFLVPGDQNTDLDGQPRFMDDPAVANTGAPFPTYLDRGAYESVGRPYCVGDMDDDHDVELDDLTVLLSQFGTTGTALPSDQNRNGTVDLEDLAILLSNFGDACP